MIKTVIIVVAIIILLVWLISRKAKAEENSTEMASEVQPSEDEEVQEPKTEIIGYVTKDIAFVAL